MLALLSSTSYTCQGTGARERDEERVVFTRMLVYHEKAESEIRSVLVLSAAGGVGSGVYGAGFLKVLLHARGCLAYSARQHSQHR
jgi:hypothetical protein